ncbi:MAG: M28 family peptidase [Clostridia bacterium]|nr:M28 family peptidase [Clostridia bacterium]
MNKLRKIYYPILAVLLVLLLVFSALSVTVNFSTPFISTSVARTNAEKIAKAGNYDLADDIQSSSSLGDRYKIVSAINTVIKNTLTAKYKNVYDTNGNSKTYTTGATSTLSSIVMGQYVVTDEDGKDEKKFELAPSYYSSRITVDQADLDAIDNYKEKGLYKGMMFQNIALYVPGSQTKSGLARSARPNDYTFSYDESKLADVVMMVAHYDSAVGDNGYINNSATIGTMLALLDEIVNGGKTYKNDIMMVFTDASYRNGLGLDFFMHSPEYSDIFDNALSRVKTVAIFDNVGEVSTIVASQAKGSDTVSVFATAGDWYHSGSFSGDIASVNIGTKEFDVVDGVSAIEILGIGNVSEITTASSLDNATLSRIATVIGSFTDRFGNADLGVLDSNATIGFYSYVGLNFWYASYVSYIIGAIILIIAGFTVWYLIKKQTFSPTKVGFGAAVSALSVIATALSLLVVYLLAVLLLSLIGTVSVISIATLVTSNIWFFIIAFVLGLVLLTVYNVIFRKVFKVKALDVVRGNAWIVMLLAVVMCIVFPTYSYLFAGLALAQGASMLCTILFKDKFKSKFVFDIERLLPYGAFAVLLSPVVFAEAIVAYSVSPAILLPLILTLVFVYAQSVVPYVLIIKDLYGISALSSVAETSDGATEAKKTPIVSKKTVALTAMVTVIAYAVVLIVGLLCAQNNGLVATQSSFSGSDSIYNNAFIYEYNNVNGKKSTSILLKDQDLYTFMKNDLGEFQWNAQKGAYGISDDTDDSYLPVSSSSYVPFYKHSSSMLFKFGTDANGNDIRLGERPAMTITFKIVKAGDQITSVRLINNVGSLTSTVGQSASKYEEIIVNGNEVTLTIPAGYGTDLGVEVFTKAKDKTRITVDLEVEVNAVYVAGNIDQMGDLASVAVENDVISALSTKYSNSEILNNIYFVFEYNYVGTTKVAVPLN